MDVLKNKQYKNYNYLSRYTSFPYYYNSEDDKCIYGLTSQLNKDNTIVLHNVKQYDTLDNLANYYYGRPDLYWVIADFNNIQDPFVELFNKYTTLEIPTLTTISFRE